MASVMAGISVGPQPESHGVRFTARPALRTRESIVHRTITPASVPSRLSPFGKWILLYVEYPKLIYHFTIV